ncbi:MAG TPA: hypothetical protein VH083_02585 [Myxococcales bacterium]|jgi:hypothetical protein|nr:hypothetical protein [Myxococcales bacterium]
MARPRKNPDPIHSLIDHLAEAIATRLGGAGNGAARAKAPARKRNFSVEGIERIRTAAKKRWAKYRRDKKKTLAAAAK